MAQDPNISQTKIIFLGIAVGILWLLAANFVWAAEEVPVLQDVQFHPLPDDKVQVELVFSRPIAPPKGFSVESPASIILDFHAVLNRLPKALSNQTLNMGQAKGINVIEGGDKTRVVISLKKSVPFETEVHGNRIFIILNGETKTNIASRGLNECYQIHSFDFRRGKEGEGRLIFNLSSPKAAIDFKEEKGKIMVRFARAEIADRLLRQYDVVDFGTPIHEFSLSRQGDDVLLAMEANGDFDKIAYQMDNQFIIEVRSLTKEERAALKSEGRFTGERISLNFQDVEIRAVLQIIADFAGFNLITSDSVKGNITLRLQNVPWDQALDIVLKSKSLDKRQQGNVVMVAPAEEIAIREKQELENQKQVEDLGPLRSEFIQINYAKAEDLAGMLKEKSNSLMTARGNVTVDKRTNALLVQDIPEKIAEIKALIKKLDIAVRQVEISTQIITADESCEDALGMRFGGALNPKFGSRRLGIGSTGERARAIADFLPSGRVPPSMPIIPNGLLNAPPLAGPTIQTTEGLFSDLGTTTSAGIASLGLALARLPNGTLLDLELQALELESKTKTIARPKLMTTDQTKAVVEQGLEIPYQEASSSGATSTSYRKAVLKLEVTPQITPDGKITLALIITNDSRGEAIATSNGGEALTINTNRLETTVLVDNGETVVLGGILTITKVRRSAKVPFFGDIPFLGAMFRNRNREEIRKELLIFITPKIVKPALEG